MFVRAMSSVILIATFGCEGSHCSAGPCEQEWRVETPSWMCSGTVKCSTLWDPDGAGPLPEVLIAGGSFSQIGDVQTSGIAMFDGERWKPLGAGLSNDVQALEVIDGKLLAGGSFGGGCAQWDGTAWKTFGGGVTGTVRAIKSFQGDVVVGGDITAFGGASIRGVARFRNGKWEQIGSGGDRPIAAMEVFRGELYIAGAFVSWGGVAVSSIARTDGEIWKPVGAGVSKTGTTISLAAGAEELVVGGSLTKAGGIAAKNVATWDGVQWTVRTMDKMTSVASLRVSGGVVYAAGLYETASTSVPMVGKLEAGTWTALDAGFVARGSGSSTPVMTTAELGGELFAGGEFELTIGGKEGFARLDNGVWSPLALSTNGQVSQVVAVGDKLYAIGSFTRIGTVPAPMVAVWDREAWTALSSSLSGRVNSVAKIGDDLWLVGLNLKNGTSEWGYALRGQGSDLSHASSGLQRDPSGIIDFGGTPVAFGFSILSSLSGGTTAVGYWSGTTWLPLGTGLEGTITHALVLDGDLIVTGQFMRLGGVSFDGQARWDGMAWSLFAPGRTTRGDKAMIVHEGRLTLADPYQMQPVWRWTGAQWERVGDNLTGTVSSLVSMGRDLYATGRMFVRKQGVSKLTELARWNGTVWVAVDHPLTGMSRPQPAGGVSARFGDEVVLAGMIKRIADSKSIPIAFLSAAPCVGDLDCDGMITMDDFDGFVVAFEAGEPLADRNEDGFLTFDDFDAFVEAYERGC